MKSAQEKEEERRKKRKKEREKKRDCLGSFEFFSSVLYKTKKKKK